MKATYAAPVLIALGLVTGCGQGNAPTSKASASTPPNASAPLAAVRPVSRVAPQPDASAAAETAGPLLKTASYPPRDDCNALPGWSAFRARLDQAVAKRDADALAALTDRNVDLDFGGGQGIEEMRRRLDDKDYRLWDEIARLLPLGCAAQDGGATMPWIFARAPENIEAYSGMLVLGADVPARAKPDANADFVARLNWAMVTTEAYEEPDKPFAKVTLPGGKSAYVETAKLRSIIDYRLLASRTKQGWRITAIIAGD